MASSPKPACERRPFPRAARLVRSSDFQRVYRRGNRARGDLMTVAAADNGLATTRLGLSVGRVVWKHAVRRNRVKRVLREAFRLSRHELPDGVDLVLIPCKGAWPDLEGARAELVRLAHKAWGRYREKIEREREAEA
jgi:ribonuclease P protein component